MVYLHNYCYINNWMMPTVWDPPLLERICIKFDFMVDFEGFMGLSDDHTLTVYLWHAWDFCAMRTHTERAHILTIAHMTCMWKGLLVCTDRELSRHPAVSLMSEEHFSPIRHQNGDNQNSPYQLKSFLYFGFAFYWFFYAALEWWKKTLIAVLTAANWRNYKQ